MNVGIFVSQVISHCEMDSAGDNVLFSTILGAIIGAVCTFIGSLVINSFAEKRKREIKNKERILEPLYDEIKKIHCKILVDKPYPKVISLAEGSQTVNGRLQYVVWDEIKNDSRYFDVPQSLKRRMNDLYIAIEEYENSLQEVILDFNKIYISEFKRDTDSSVENQRAYGNRLLNAVLKCHLLGDKFVEIDNMSFNYTELTNRDSYKRYLISYEKWFQQEEIVLKELESIICKVS